MNRDTLELAGVAIVMAAIAMSLILFCSGCGGLQWVPPGGNPPIGSTPFIEGALDRLGDADAAGWGDLAQILGGMVGAGGMVAVGRKVLRNHRERKALGEDNDLQAQALREIVTGVRSILNNEIEPEAFKLILGEHQSAETRKLVARLKIEDGAD